MASSGTVVWLKTCYGFMNRNRQNCLPGLITGISASLSTVSKKKGFAWGCSLIVCLGMHIIPSGLPLTKGVSRLSQVKQEQCRCLYFLNTGSINTLSNALALAGPDAFFIDLTTTNNKLFCAEGKSYYIGGGFMQEYWERYSKPMIAKKQFNGLIFVNTTTSAVPINRKPVK